MGQAVNLIGQRFGRLEVLERARSGRWTASIVHGYKQRHLGTFQTAEDAARAYDAKAVELFGEFAWLNFPGEAQSG